ncbi:unnamed protein product [Cochlearia groenlandica]
MMTSTLSGNYGFPLCISGIAQQLNLSKEMADHDKRRKGMKMRKRSEVIWLQESEDVRDLVALLQDLCLWGFTTSHTAKAA